MAGYKWQHKFRCTPDNGAVDTIDVATSFSDLGGPVSTRVDYTVDQETLTDVNRGRAVLFRGFRPVVRMDFEVFDTRDQTTFATIVNRLCSDAWTVELSLDGGAIYREVVLDRLDGPNPIRGKTVVGASYSLTVAAVDLISEYPDMNVTDGGTRNPDVYAW